MSGPSVAATVDEVHRLVLDDPAVAEALDGSTLASTVRRTAPLLSPAEVAEVVAAVRARATGYGLLEPLLADPGVTEVMVNGAGPVWVEREGRLVRTAVEVDAATVDRLVARVLAPVGARADRGSPMADARLPDGSRVHVVVPPLAVDGPCITIRRFTARTVALADFAPPAVVDLLVKAVADRRSIVISGGAGAGKTTFLNALAAHVDPTERIVTIEDAAELRLPGDHVVRLEARPPSVEGTGAVTVRDLVRSALRMRPDRIVVGEVRGGEAIDMLQALNTGHDGSLTTCHANGPDDALRRIETMALTGADLPLVALREQIASAVDLVVQVGRAARGARRVTAVAEVERASTSPQRVRELVRDGAVIAAPSRPPRRRPLVEGEAA